MNKLIAAAALTALAAGAAIAHGEKAAAPHLTGDYVEARTASVFAGACHYNGELTTTGRDAELVWHFRSGGWNGIDLSGLNAIAAVSANDNLKNGSAARRTVVFIDDRATPTQAEAIGSLIRTEYKGALGHILAVKRAPITFSRSGESFKVDAKGVGALAVDAMPNRECCKQPNLVWYNPLVGISDRRVGFTRESGIDDATLGVSWSKFNQNTAFYGTFTIAR